MLTGAQVALNWQSMLAYGRVMPASRAAAELTFEESTLRAVLGFEAIRLNGELRDGVHRRRVHIRPLDRIESAREDRNAVERGAVRTALAAADIEVVIIGLVGFGSDQSQVKRAAHRTADHQRQFVHHLVGDRGGNFRTGGLQQIEGCGHLNRLRGGADFQLHVHGGCRSRGEDDVGSHGRFKTLHFDAHRVGAPTGSAGIAKSPVLVVWVATETLVAELVATTRACGTAAPEESVTEPPMIPRSVWASSILVEIMRRADKALRIV